MTTPQEPAGPGRPQQWAAPPATGYGPPPGFGTVPYGEPPQPYGGRAHGGPVLMQQTSSQAIVVLCLAVGSFVVLPLVLAVVALALAPGARDQIAASGGRLGGEGLVTAAKVLSWINIGLCLAGVLAVAALLGLFATVGFS